MSKRIKRRILPRRKISGGLTIGSVINCADNTGARRLKIIQMLVITDDISKYFLYSLFLVFI